MKSSCEGDLGTLTALHHSHRKVLIVVLVINFVMFLVELVFGILAHSTALLGDSLDMLEDTLVYGVSIFVLGRGARWQAGTAVLKGLIMAALGLGVLSGAAFVALSPRIPVAETMGAIGFLALFANSVCAMLLYRHRSDDVNMRSTWLCSRNDALSNLGVLAAAALVAYTQSKWPDVIAGGVIATLFLGSAIEILKDSWRGWKGARHA